MNGSFVSENFVGPSPDGSDCFDCCDSIVRNENLFDDSGLGSAEFVDVGLDSGEATVEVLLDKSWTDREIGVFRHVLVNLHFRHVLSLRLEKNVRVRADLTYL